MRLLICDDHVVFAESLACLLRTLGKDVVAVTHHPAQAVAVLRAEEVDVCLLDVMFGADNGVSWLGALRDVAPSSQIVLLCSLADDALFAAARPYRVGGVADKRQPIAEIVTLIDRVHAGDSMLPSGRTGASPATTRRAAASAGHFLAAFLTPREREVLSALVGGTNTASLARMLGITQTTARCHIQSVLTKMGAHSRLEAATTAVRHGMINPATGEWLIAG
ncbi:response regulator transcription factor [Dactylosporangium fulvum]|uniref:Response regulator transcription factor n=1 Tax=Dactylosporangium fulvum TaxID=53359 RepID=A0ABY5W665_9ACTN|nr:response regulator transcription factor [Dactylosporangium fulvum]UWP85488.1 response regulator transcription factor [Dactylosporangium fulvum]